MKVTYRYPVNYYDTFHTSPKQVSENLKTKKEPQFIYYDLMIIN